MKSELMRQEQKDFRREFNRTKTLAKFWVVISILIPIIMVIVLYITVENKEADIANQLDNAEVQVGMVDEKVREQGGSKSQFVSIGKSFYVNSDNKTNYIAIVDGMEFELSRQEWNQLTEGEEIEYKYLDDGSFRLIE